jgi:hypothetical protein
MTKESGIEPINNILDKPINVSINSITSYIWLPKTACEKIEKAFNLTWNDAEQFYLLDDATYQNLEKASPTFTFTLLNGTGDVHINVPYEALDLDIALPVLQMVPQNQTVKYLPIKRSWKKDQYTLGRAFLPEAYLQVDYHTRKFNISQARWPDEIDILKTDIKAVYPKKIERHLFSLSVSDRVDRTDWGSERRNCSWSYSWNFGGILSVVCCSEG